jgi:hypothetical protein
MSDNRRQLESHICFYIQSFACVIWLKYGKETKPQVVTELGEGRAPQAFLKDLDGVFRVSWTTLRE